MTINDMNELIVYVYELGRRIDQITVISKSRRNKNIVVLQQRCSRGEIVFLVYVFA